MADDRLIEHYDHKYGAEASVTAAPDAVPLRLARPADRYQAACAYIPPRLPPHADVLELGAGAGVIAESLRVGGVDFASYTIGDISTARLAGLRRAFTSDPRFQFVQADADHPAATLSEYRFDVAIMVALIEHLVDPMRAMAELRLLLKPGGFVFIDTPNIAKWTRRVRLLSGRFPSTASANEGLTTYAGEPADLYDEGHLHYFTFRSLSLMLTERCGYSRVEPMPYYPDTRFAALGIYLATRRPSLFSELDCIAWA